MVLWPGFEPEIEVYKTPVITTLTTRGYWYDQGDLNPYYHRERVMT